MEYAIKLSTVYSAMTLSNFVKKCMFPLMHMEYVIV